MESLSLRKPYIIRVALGLATGDCPTGSTDLPLAVEVPGWKPVRAIKGCDSSNIKRYVNECGRYST